MTVTGLKVTMHVVSAGDGESVQSGNSKASEYVFADNVAWCSEEEIEAAIVQASLILPQCSTIIPSCLHVYMGCASHSLKAAGVLVGLLEGRLQDQPVSDSC